MTTLLRGTELHPADKQHVLAAFVHRFTKDNPPPRWAQNTNYKPQFANDEDWLANSLFYVTVRNRLDRRFSHCDSTPTWPDGKGVWGLKSIDWDTADNHDMHENKNMVGCTICDDRKAEDTHGCSTFDSSGNCIDCGEPA